MAKQKQQATPTVSAVPSIVDLPINLIDVESEFNARSEMDPEVISGLAESIKRDGQLSPVRVRRKKDGRFMLVYGFQRLAAISWPEKRGGLGRDTIRAEIVETAEGKDKDALLEDMYVNLAENMARENLNAYDAAARVELMKSRYEQSGAKIANRIGKSAPYVNNLLRIREKLIPVILERWRKESSPQWDKKVVKVCSTDRLAKWAGLDAEKQDLEFRRALGEDVDGEGDDEGEEGEGGGERSGVRRPGKRLIEQALDHAKKGYADASNAGQQEKCKAVMDALKFCLGELKSIPATGFKPTQSE